MRTGLPHARRAVILSAQALLPPIDLVPALFPRSVRAAAFPQTHMRALSTSMIAHSNFVNSLTTSLVHTRVRTQEVLNLDFEHLDITTDEVSFDEVGGMFMRLVLLVLLSVLSVCAHALCLIMECVSFSGQFQGSGSMALCSLRTHAQTHTRKRQPCRADTGEP